MISVIFAHCNFNMSPIDSKKVSKNKKVENSFCRCCTFVQWFIPWCQVESRDMFKFMAAACPTMCGWCGNKVNNMKGDFTSK